MGQSGPFVLVVDDDPDIREVVAEVLRDEGYQVEEAEHGEAALRVLRERHAPCLMLLDLMMPVMNGFQVLEELRQARSLPETNVVAMTAGRTSREELGGLPLVYKPLNLDEILDLVAAHCIR